MIRGTGWAGGIAMAVLAAACGGREGDSQEEVEVRMEQGARAIGGRVGEALEETGEAIEEAGRRIQEEAGEPVAGDTSRM